MKIDIITLFPDFFDEFKTHSIIGRAIRANKLEIITHNLRDYSADKYKTVDDHPYGGGAGMVLKFDVLLKTLKSIKTVKPKVILLTPQGQVYKQVMAQKLAQETNFILICGHYEGFDERIRQYVDLELSIGDYVLTGGEIPAMVVVDSVARLIPGVLGDDKSSVEESHADGVLEYPQYTRPVEYDGKKVPEILLSGNHSEIEKWRREQAQERTKVRRPDLLREKI